MEIPISEVCRYLRVRGEPDSRTLALIEECACRIQDAATPRHIWREFALPPSQGASGVRLEGTDFVLEGQDIRRHLEGCGRCVLMAATLGAQVDRLIAAAQVTDMARAVVLDCCATAAIESYCDQVQRGLEREKAAGEEMTFRFSPGYGDLPLECQREFTRLLDTQRRIGLTASASQLLIPRKSVTAVIGFGRVAKGARRGCESCGLYESCLFRKEGKSCGNS